jgi:hypothetical protein
MVMDCDHNGDGQWTAMDGNGRRWMARWRLDGDGRRNGSLAAMDSEGWRERDADGL